MALSVAPYCFSGLCHSDLTVDVMPGPDTFSFMSPKNVMPDAASNPQREAPADGRPTSLSSWQI